MEVDLENNLCLSFALNHQIDERKLVHGSTYLVLGLFSRQTLVTRDVGPFYSSEIGTIKNDCKNYARK